MTRTAPFLLVALTAACTPNNATLTSGRYETFVASSTSRIVFEDKVQLDGSAEHYNID